jgi:hypothetical protein
MDVVSGIVFTKAPVLSQYSAAVDVPVKLTNNTVTSNMIFKYFGLMFISLLHQSGDWYTWMFHNDKSQHSSWKDIAAR